MNNAVASLKNYFNPGYFPVVTPLPGQAPKKKGGAASFAIAPLQFERIRHDIQLWREAVAEAENAWTPLRVKLARLFQDTILNEHIEACIEKRKNLTLIRKFKICDSKGKENEDLTKLFQKTWFQNFQSYVIDALLHGYNLISLGDLDGTDSFPQLSFVKRQNISPDRRVVSSLLYSLSGQKFDEEPFKTWYIYVDTPTSTGATPCGYGLLYKIAKTEIFLRNNTGQNADYNELFGQPVRKATTTKTEKDRQIFEDALRNMGSSAYIILDEGQDTLELVRDSSTGSAHQTYSDFEERCEKKISKVLLGHADALDSTPGKLGSTAGEDNPAAKAMMDIQTRDAAFVQPIINEQLLPRMRNLGFNIPEEFHFEYVNDDEQEEYRKKQDESNQVTAQLFKSIKDAGGKLTEETWKYFEERTGIPGIEKMEEPDPAAMPGLPGGLPGAKKPVSIKEALNRLYGNDYLNFDESVVERVPAGNMEGGQWTKIGSGSEVRTKLRKAFNKAVNLVKENGGFSLNENLSAAEDLGYIVALGGYERQIPMKYFDEKDIKSYYYKYLSKFKNEKNLILGGWHNTDNGVVYLDISKSFNNIDEAIDFGKKSNQLKGWDAKNGREFDIMSKIKNILSERQQSNKLRAMFSNCIYNVPLSKGHEDDTHVVDTATGVKKKFFLIENDVVNFREGQVLRKLKGDPEGGQWTSEWATSGKEFEDKKKSLRIPPWTDVHISKDDEADLLATGIDAKGRKQYLYSQNHHMKQAEIKFARNMELLEKFKSIEEQNKRNLLYSNDKQVKESAAVLALIISSGIRPGSDSERGADKWAYGATTLEGRHVVELPSGAMRLKFIGKKGVDNNITISDRDISAMLLKRKAEAGAKGRLFDVSDSQLRDYVASLDGGNFHPKDFRTLKGTATAMEEIKLPKYKPAKSEKEYKKMVKAIAVKVSKVLGNTPAIALKSYINPFIFIKLKPR